MFRILLKTLTGCAMLAVVSTSADAQQRKTGTLAGVVMDEHGAAVPNVEVAVAKLARTVRTDSAGKFILGFMPVGSFDVSFRRLSYTPIMVMIEITPGDTTEAEVKLNVAAAQMTTVKVEESPERSRTLDGFEDRRKMGIGHFITRKQIEERNPLLLSDMTRTIPGTEVRARGANGRAALRFTRASAHGDCPPNYYVDGIFLAGYNIDDMPVSDVEAIELYPGTTGLPPQFAKARSTLVCGTIAIWTRIPGKKK
jgi:hypothetical protein